MFELNALTIHYYIILYTMADILVIYAKAREFKAKAKKVGFTAKVKD